MDNITGKLRPGEDSMAILRAELLHWPSEEKKQEETETCESISTPSTSKKDQTWR